MPPLTPHTDKDGNEDEHQTRSTLLKSIYTSSPSVSSPATGVSSDPPIASRTEIQSNLIYSSSPEVPVLSFKGAPKGFKFIQEITDDSNLEVDHHLEHPSVRDTNSARGIKCLTFIRKGDFDIVWLNVILFTIAHGLHFYSLHYILTSEDYKTKYTWFFSYWVGVAGGLGITAGAHRLWSHKSYEARLPLRIFLMIGQCIAGQNSLYVWCRDHRVHHKFSETDGDPHNTNRGFFFAHVGWLLRKKHPEMIRKSKTLDFTDLLADPVVKFQKDYYIWLYLVFAMFGPCLIPTLLWGESFWRSLLVVYISRYLTSLHSTWFVNSTAHMFGDRPYNLEIQPRENLWVSYGAFGEGYHNYHHTFPWDYATSELGGKLNLTKIFIDFMALLGLAYNLKRPSDKLVKSRKDKVSDHHHHDHMTDLSNTQPDVSNNRHEQKLGA